MNRGVLAIAAAAGATMLVLDRRLNLWTDEGYTLESTDRGVLHAARAAVNYELYPPLYFAALAAWRTLDRSSFFARTFSTLAATLFIVDGARTARAYVPDADETSVALALALNPLVVSSGTEARPYASMLWLGVRILGAFRDAYLVAHPQRGARARFVAWAILAIHTHVYLGFILLGCGIACVVARPRRVGSLASDAALIAAAIAPLAFAMRAALACMSENYREGHAPRVWMRDLMISFAAFVLPSGGPKAIRRPIVVGGAIVLAGLLIRDRSFGTPARVPLVVAGASAATWIATIVVAKTPPLLPAHATQFAFPTIVAALAVLRTRARTRAGALVSAAFGAGAFVALVRTDAKVGDWKRVAAYLERHARPDQPIAVFGAESALPLRRHYRGPNRIDGLPTNVAFDRYDLSRFVIRDAGQLDRALAHAAGAEVWLATTNTEWTVGPNFRADLLEDYVAARYTTLRDERFFGSRLRLLAPRRTATVS